MPATIKELAAYSDELLQAKRFHDYCPNGLQVEDAPKSSACSAG